MSISRRFLQPINLLNATSDPTPAEQGDLYYNSTSDKIRFYDGSQWNDVGSGSGGGVTVSETAPASPELGDGWFKSSTSELFFYDGTYWIEATSTVDNFLLFEVGTTPPEDPMEGQGWFDNVSGDFYIYDGTYWQQAVNTVLVGLDQDTSPSLSADLDANGYNLEDVGHIDFDLTPSTSAATGRTVWNVAEGTLDLGLEDGVVLQSGQHLYVRVKNDSGSIINTGEIVYVIDAGESTPGHPSHALIEKFIADGSIDAAQVIGLTTKSINNGNHGYVTSFGMVRGLNTSAYPAGTPLYASPTVLGGLTDTEPISPNLAVVVGVVVASHATAGSILVNPRIYPTADLITYDNSDADLISTNVKGALDELSVKKADINSLSSNINLYPTTVSSTISGYFKMVSSLEDEDYNDSSTNVETDPITTTNQLISSLVSEAGLIIGNPGVVGITTIGKIAKTAGNANAFAEFFFRVYHRDAAGTETLIGTSDTTGAVNPEILNTFFQFSASAVTNFITFVETDRIVIKYYANILDVGSPQYRFEFGGATPVRTLVPVPVSVIPVADASGIIVNTSTFNGVLSSSDTTVQAALNTLDDLDVLPDQSGNSGKFLGTDGTVASWQEVVQGSGGGSIQTDIAISNSWWLGV